MCAHGQGAYLQTGLIQAFAAHLLLHQPPRRLGLASPGEAFGHRQRLAALEATGSSGSRPASNSAPA